VRLGDGQYELKISNKDRRIEQVWFPYHLDGVVLNSHTQDDILFYPHFFGTAEKPDHGSPWTWSGFDYPGHTYAPLVVLADETDGFMVAATNWPPRRVKPTHSKNRMRFLYYDAIEPGENASYRLMIVRVRSERETGAPAWQLALDPYKLWLRDRMGQDGLWPVPYPQWMAEVEGFLDVQLQNGGRQFHVGEIYELWNKWSGYFPWIQFWGQMRDAIVNTPKRAFSTAQFHEMLENRQLHERYVPELIDFTRNITNNPLVEGHVGFYTKTRRQAPLLDGQERISGETSLEFLLHWFEINKERYHANAFYVDTLGNGYRGDPIFVAKLFVTQFPRNMMIEYPVDIYPTAFYVSGCLSAGINYRKWGQNPEHFKQGRSKITFPRFGRYLLNDRIIFMGQGNGDHIYWGRKGDYRSERQAFLLGSKYEVITAADNPNDRSSGLNKALELIISERRRVGWWSRRPVYQDTRGLSHIPEGVGVRRFVDTDGVDLFTVDNWRRLKGLKFRFMDQWIAVPERQISIVQAQ
jgi:hypothetical protein